MVTRASESTSNLFTADGGGLELVVVSPNGTSHWRLPSRGEVLIGRDPTMTVRIPDTSVSRHHLTLVVVEDAVVAIDRDSHNGTSIAGARVPSGAKITLAPGTAIQIGATTLVLRPASAVSDDAGAGSIVLDPAMKRLYELVDVVAPAPISVLVLGETGSGKEVIAAAIHRRSPRAARPMLRLNCAAIPSSVIEGELFGFEKGAFTGAVQSKPGLLEAAHASTLFLDEVGDAPLDVQAKLLRFLETGEVLRVGALSPRVVDVRVVAATNRDVNAMIAAGTFRADLFYRLNGLTLEVPPLRRRRDEILPLATSFARASATRLGRAVPTLTAATQSALMEHPWPGNVRELRAVIERAVVLASGAAIEPQHLLLAPPPPAPSAADAVASSSTSATVPPPGGADLGDADLAAIQAALAQTAGNQSRAAKLLGISRKTLLKRLEQYDVPRPRKNR